MQTIERITYRVSETAVALGYSRAMTYQLIASGEIPSIKVGKSIRVPVAALKTWIDKQLREKVDQTNDEQKKLAKDAERTAKQVLKAQPAAGK